MDSSWIVTDVSKLLGLCSVSCQAPSQSDFHQSLPSCSNKGNPKRALVSLGIIKQFFIVKRNRDNLKSMGPLISSVLYFYLYVCTILTHNILICHSICIALHGIFIE